MKQNAHKLTKYILTVENIINDNTLDIEQKKSVVNSLIKTLTMGIQSDININLINKNDINLQLHRSDCFPTDTYCQKCYTFLPSHHEEKFIIPVNLNSASIISPIWNQKRLIQAFRSIGTDVNNPFKFQPNNHFYLLYIKPLGLFFNLNGLHSTNTGIVKGEGQIFTSHMIDISESFKNYYFDGTFFVHKNCQAPISEPSDYRLGIIYEIGRSLTKYEINLY